MTNYQNFVKLAREGDSTACQALYEDTVDSVYFIISRLVDRKEDVEDLVQDTYLSAFSHLDQLTQPQAFPKWIHNIAANNAKNHLKKCKPVLFATDEEEERMLSSIPAVGEDFLPEEYARNKELRSQLMDAIAGLPEKQKDAVYLYYYEDMSVKELSEMLEVGANTVKSRLNAGRAGIREHLRRLGITSSALVVLALAVRAEASEYQAPEASRNAIWAGVQQNLPAVVSAGGGALAGGSASAKAGFLATLGGKITAAAVAVAVLAGGAFGISQIAKDKPAADVPAAEVQEESAWVSEYGIPEEMGRIEEMVESEGEEGMADLLKLVRHEFGQIEATCDFNGIARIEYYADGYKKVYLERELTQQISIDGDQEYLLRFLDAEGECFSELSYSDSPMRGSFNDTDGYTKVMVNGDGRAVYYLTKSYLRDREPVRMDVVLESDPEQTPVLTLTRDATGLPVEESTEATEETTEATAEATEPAVTEPEGTYVTTQVLDVAGRNLQEISAVLGDYSSSNGFYWFNGGSLGFVFAYGEENGSNYITGSMHNILKNAPETMSTEELQQYFPGGYEFFDEMDYRDCYAWDYNGCTLVIFKGNDGFYHSGAGFYYNCDALAQQNQQSQQPQQTNVSVNEELFQILGKSKSQVDEILGFEGGYDYEYGCWAYLYQDSFVSVYLDDDGSSTCIGFNTPLKNAVNMSGAVDAAQLQQLFGSTYNDPWNGETSYCTMYKGGQLRIFQEYDNEVGSFSGESAVNFRMAGKEFFPANGEQSWNNSDSLFYGVVTVYSQTSTELVCAIAYSQLTPPNRIDETGRITLTSTDGVTYTASGVEDSWGSVWTITVTMLEEAAKFTFDCTQVGELANFAFGDFIAYKS